MDSTAYLLAADITKAALHPRVACTLLAVAALIAFISRWWIAGGISMVAALALAAAALIAPISDLAIRSLEHRFPAWGEGSHARVAGIVVLGGGDERLIEAAHLARRFPAAKVVYSTGGGPDARAAVLSQLVNLGIPVERAAVNTLSRNTTEDAAAAVMLAQPQTHERWVLVTSAVHMPRAIASFRAVGFTVEPDPIARSSTGTSKRWLELSSGPEKIHQALKEYVGILAYFLLGRTTELFPGV